MAKNRKNARRPDSRQVAAQQRPTSGGPAAQRNAQRRQQRRRQQTTYLGWGSVAVVVIVVAVFLVVRLTGTSNPKPNTASLRSPAPASVTGPLASIPAKVFNSVGVANLAPPLTVTAKQPKLTSNGLIHFVYQGAEFCPYCAMERWAMVAALNRFGSFTGLKITTSSNQSGEIYPNTPTLSFYGSKYTSKYLVFSSYEDEDRNHNALETVPNNILALYAKYDGPLNGSSGGTVFDGQQGGIPFIDIGNQYVAAGDPSAFSSVGNAIAGGGVTHQQIAAAVKDPSSTLGTAMSSQVLIADANYLSAAICNNNGGMPATVCKSSGVKAAAKALAAIKPIS